MASDWQKAATGKRDAILATIPQKWKLSNIPTSEEQKDVTQYVQQFLDKKEVDITETDAVGIAEKIAVGEWSAVDVTEAFCHRAAIAHQLVSIIHTALITSNIFSSIVYTKSSSMLQSQMRKP